MDDEQLARMTAAILGPYSAAARALDEMESRRAAGEDMTDQVSGYCEPWIEGKLRERLLAYKKRYPAFKMERIMEYVLTWPPKSQRWAPYMKDKDIKALNRTYQRVKSWSSLAMNEHL